MPEKQGLIKALFLCEENMDPVLNTPSKETQYSIVKYQDQSNNFNKILGVAKNIFDHSLNFFKTKTPLEELDCKITKLYSEYAQQNKQLEIFLKRAFESFKDYLAKNKLALEILIHLTQQVTDFKRKVALNVNFNHSIQQNPKSLPTFLFSHLQVVQKHIEEMDDISHMPIRSLAAEEASLQTGAVSSLALRVYLQDMTDLLLKKEQQAFLIQLQKEVEKIETLVEGAILPSAEEYLKYNDSGYLYSLNLKIDLDKNITFIETLINEWQGNTPSMTENKESFFKALTTWVSTTVFPNAPSKIQQLLLDFKKVAQDVEKARKIHLYNQEEILRLRNQLQTVEGLLYTNFLEKGRLFNPPSSPPLEDLNEFKDVKL